MISHSQKPRHHGFFRRRTESLSHSTVMLTSRLRVIPLASVSLLLFLPLLVTCGRDNPTQSRSTVPVRITVTPESADLASAEQSVRISATVLDGAGGEVSDTPVSWRSSDASVATVNGEGVVTATGEGSALITAMAGQKTASARVTVSGPVRRVLVDPAYAVLLALFVATDGGNWTNSDGWGESYDLGRWYGVSTDSLGRVAGLDLSSNNLNGKIPPELGDLVHLGRLDLSSNDLRGALPLSLARLAKLARFNYYETDLCVPADASLQAWLESIPNHRGTGAYCAARQSDRDILVVLYHATGGPNWTNNTNWLSDRPVGEWHGVTTNADGRVVFLVLSRNQLTGSIPPELGGLASLRELRLAVNQLTGRIPPELGRLAALEDLALSRNQLTGEIPPEIGSLAALETLHLHHNRLMGSIPPELGQLARLRHLWLPDNQLTGRIPPELSRLARLDWLALDNNLLMGPLPLSLAGLSELVIFDYGATRLCVPADDSFRAWLAAIQTHRGTGVDCAPLSNRDILVILYHATDGPNWANNTNWLSDRAIEEWHGVTGSDGWVEELDLSNNRLTGEIPPELGGLAALEALDLRNNQLTGRIPLSLGRLPYLEEGLQLSNNQLTGSIPPELGNLSSLESLQLNNNQLTGSIPAELGRLASLAALDLSGNQLTGEIPPELGSLAGLVDLRLNDNLLTGTIPPSLGSLEELGLLWLSHNKLTGAIPAELGSLDELELLWLSHNKLTGGVTAELGGLGDLEWLVVGDNPLSGPLPLALAGLPLEVFGYSDSDLCVPVDASFRAWLDSHSGSRGHGRGLRRPSVGPRHSRGAL